MSMDPDLTMAEMLEIMRRYGMDTSRFESAEELAVKDLIEFTNLAMELLNFIHRGGHLPSNLEEAAGR